MPMIWNAEADAKLLAAILQVSNVKLSAAQMAEVATLMGPDCTAKAISHRLTHFRKLAGDTMSGLKVDHGAEKPAKKTKKTAKTPKTSKGKGMKRDRDAIADADDDEEAGVEGDAKKGDEIEEDSKSKKVKVEEGDADDF